ncbi:Cyclic nucleotide-binding domain protein [Hartmannibacter diazotrophicus]|uniref:Cyclic nucleotide-binding domain protein n=2 Tax=Hartmannibacter diazotrophicus TaxID=1482074 RepID=A0A2C9DBI7_9HYPH|nr:Cyclic nucleotide-binding domain protein [Hartmannibacter diazotrophicus]
MMDFIQQDLAKAFSQPDLMVGHLIYLVLVASMFMRNIVWLRSLAIVYGMMSVAYRILVVVDPVSVLWQSIFVLVNLVQLAIIWWLNRPPSMTEEERRMLEAIAPGASPSEARILLSAAEWREVPDGAVLAEEGKPVGGLMYISAGTAQVQSRGRNAGDCGPGDFIGEMTWADGGGALATVLSSGAVRYAWFSRELLAGRLIKCQSVRYALQASISRNLVQKLVRATAKPVAGPTLPAAG